MTEQTTVTIKKLRAALSDLPSNALVEIAIDPELNAAGPIASNETGAVLVFETRLQKGNHPVVVLLPEFTQAWDDRYTE